MSTKSRAVTTLSYTAKEIAAFEALNAHVGEKLTAKELGVATANLTSINKKADKFEGAARINCEKVDAVTKVKHPYKVYGLSAMVEVDKLPLKQPGDAKLDHIAYTAGEIETIKALNEHVGEMLSLKELGVSSARIVSIRNKAIKFPEDANAVVINSEDREEMVDGKGKHNVYWLDEAVDTGSLPVRA